MKLFDWIFKRNELSKKERELLESMGSRIEKKLGQGFYFNSLRRILYSKDNTIAITSEHRHLYQLKRMRKVERKDLLFQKTNVGDARNMFPRRQFEAITKALDWECEVYMGQKGNAPALFRAGGVNIWLSPIIIK